MTKTYSRRITLVIKVEANNLKEANSEITALSDAIRYILPTGVSDTKTDHRTHRA